MADESSQADMVTGANWGSHITAYDGHGRGGGVKPEPGMRVWWADSQSDDAVSGIIDRSGVEGWWVVKPENGVEVQYPPSAFYASRVACLRSMLKAETEVVERHAIGLAAAKLRRAQVEVALEAAEAESV